MYQLWITSFFFFFLIPFFFFFFSSHPPNRCLSVIVMSSSYPSKWFVHYKWVTKVAIEPLHSSKLLMCAQSVQRGGEKEQERRGIRRKRERGRERMKRNVKVTLFWLENQKGGHINCWLYLVFWISGKEATPSYSSRCTYCFERLKMKNAVICIVYTPYSVERMLINILRDCKVCQYK